MLFRADSEAWTRNLFVGNEVLYQLSYIRKVENYFVMLSTDISFRVKAGDGYTLKDAVSPR